MIFNLDLMFATAIIEKLHQIIVGTKANEFDWNHIWIINYGDWFNFINFRIDPNETTCENRKINLSNDLIHFIDVFKL